MLLDTCTIAELRKPEGHPAVKAAVGRLADADVFLSVVSIGEIAKGIALLDACRKQQDLAAWLAMLEARFADRILGLDIETARTWGEMTARAQRSGSVIAAPDGLIAATALRHGLVILTRNTRHFEPSGALVRDPWPDAGG